MFIQNDWLYETLDETVDAEVMALPPELQARFLRAGDVIVAGELEALPAGWVKHLGGKLWELRLAGKDVIGRAIYITAIGRRVVVLRVFVKKTQKTPWREIELARQRMRKIK